MDAIAVTSNNLKPDTAATPVRHGRPPGLFVSPVLWVVFTIACLGMGVDALMGFPVLSTILDMPDPITIAIMLALGAIAAKAATEAGINMANGKTRDAVLMSSVVAAVGLALAYARFTFGMSGDAGLQGDYGTQLESGTHAEVPATLLMLSLYLASSASIFFTSSKLFVPERNDLRRHSAARQQASARLARLEPDYAVVHERIAFRDEQSRQLTELRDQALNQADAREAELKSYARDAITRAIGRPDATPLVRAPHEPQASSQPRPEADQHEQEWPAP